MLKKLILSNWLKYLISWWYSLMKINEHEKINYIEIPSKSIKETKHFFSQVFGWTFQDFGESYSTFSIQGINGGFYQSELTAGTNNGAALIVFYSEDIDATQAKIEKAKGLIVKPIFSFPGGRRFHFSEPGGNEFAVWTDK